MSTMSLRSQFAVFLLVSAAAACGGPGEKKADAGKTAAAPAKAATPEPAKAATPEPAKAATPEPAKAPEPPKPADPSTFVPADLSAVPALAKYTVNAPAGATVTPDAPKFGETEATGAVIEKDGFKLHVWVGTIGGERTGFPIRAQQDKSKYVELKNEGEKGLLDYSFEKDGKTTLGHITAKFSTLKGSILCGNAEPVADTATLEPYKKACETLVEKKK
ncbi:hypothetical protein [Nannocystis sp. SCPEA4]|uniref:hypothetical protein n=1 Tax=Nannocystis sp. SCPEA4 TaxID=2996787 RepID=UPI00227179B7|nr:hypothetical protein [Nannocystis sp. SCPEA4]MCY1057707.1 hypothetical protein [Nannocystis sp. SCPEA4]